MLIILGANYIIIYVCLIVVASFKSKHQNMMFTKAHSKNMIMKNH